MCKVICPYLKETHTEEEFKKTGHDSSIVIKTTYEEWADCDTNCIFYLPNGDGCYCARARKEVR